MDESGLLLVVGGAEAHDRALVAAQAQRGRDGAPLLVRLRLAVDDVGLPDAVKRDGARSAPETTVRGP